MSVSPEIRRQLQSMKIPREQRPSGSYGGPRRARTRWFIVLLVLALAAGGTYLAAGKIPAIAPASAAQQDVRLVRVTPRAGMDVPPVHTATGKIVSDHRVQVATKVSGQIVSLDFEQGDRVTKGQMLARVEDVIYRARRDEAAARLAKAKAALEFQKFNYERAAGLFQKDTASQIEFVDARRSLREAEAQVAADTATLDYAQKSLRDCEVVAPISGVILERNVEVGDFVAAEGGRGAIANAQLAVIADMNVLRVEVDVSELDIARLHPDMPCAVVPEAYKDRRYQGRVMWLDPGANYSKATVQVKVRVQNPDDYLRVEGSAQVTFLADQPASAPSVGVATVWIPASACRIDAGGTGGKVFLATDGLLREHPVQLGRRAGGQIEILSGLAGGESIAAEGLEKLSDGLRIRS